MKIPHWKTYTVIAFVTTMVAVLAPESGTWLGVGHSGAMPPTGAGGTASNGVAKPQPFDYFPENYRNQAKEPAAPIDTF